MTALASALPRAQAMELAAGEYQRCAALLRSIDADGWATPTECPGWTVRDIAAHMLGMVEMAASVRESRRQTKAAVVAGEFDVDALTALQVRERADWTGARIAARFEQRWAAAVKGRRRAPGFIRRRAMGAIEVNGAPEIWTTGYLLDTILTRDPWTHRVDICRALGRQPELSAGHDGVIVADVVAEWLSRHGADVVVRLTGPAGGTWTVGTDGPVVEADAVEFCRVLSRRRGAVDLESLFGTEVPF